MSNVIEDQEQEALQYGYENHAAGVSRALRTERSYRKINEKVNTIYQIRYSVMSGNRLRVKGSGVAIRSEGQGIDREEGKREERTTCKRRRAGSDFMSCRGGDV